MYKDIKKYWILFVVEAIALLLCIPGCFQKEKLVFSAENIKNVEENLSFVYESERIELEPGVYQVRVKAENFTNGRASVNVKNDSGTFRTLKCNGAIFYAYQEYLDFEVYLSEKNDTIYIGAELFDTQTDAIDSIELYKVNLGMRMFAYLLLTIFVVLDLLLLFRKGILSGKINKEKQLVVWGLFFSVLLAYYPYLTDYFSNAADIGFHWLRIESLKETLLQGNQFPVRVQSNWLYDHGYAVSSFYGDLFLYFPAMLRILGFSLMSAYKMFVFAVMVATAVISYYSFKRCTKSTYAALFGSIIYMLAPYRVYNFYNRGAVGEYLAMTFLPLVICGMYGLYTEDVKSHEYKKAKIPLIIGLSCILQSHLLTCEMTVVFMLGICLIFIKRTLRKETFIQLLHAALICLLINCWFWWPLLKMMTADSYYLSGIISKNIQYMGTWFAELFQLYPNMGTAQDGMYNAEPFQMGIASLLMIVGGLTIILRRRFFTKTIEFKNSYDKVMIFFISLVLLTWYMSTRYFPWDFLSGIPGIGVLVTALQFPTRLFSPISVFCAITGAFFVLWCACECRIQISDKVLSKKVEKGIVVLLLLLAGGTSIYHVNDIANSRAPVWLHNAENLGSILVVNGEYLLEGSDLSEYCFHEPVTEEGLTWQNYNKQGTSIQIEVENSNSQMAYMEFPLIGYKGYGLECSTEGPYITEQRGAHGDLRVAIPAGYKGELAISYQGFMSYRIAEGISLITIIGIIFICLWRRRLQWKVKA